MLKEGRIISEYFTIRNSKAQSGQSTVEFVLTLILLIGFILFYFQLAMVFGFGSFAHYATFMSARSFLAAGPNEGDQMTRSKNIIVRMMKKSAGQAGMDKLPMIARGTGGGDPGGFQAGPGSAYQPNNKDFSWMMGVRYTFKSKLFLIPFAGSGSASGAGNGANSVTLTAESWLGKDPDNQACEAYMGTLSGIYDNGC